MPAATLSHGNQKQLELGIALAGKPELLLLDEPTAGMSVTETRESMQLLRRIAAERGLTLLFTEHDMDVVFSAADRIVVLHQGRVIAEGAPADDPRERRSAPRLSRASAGERSARSRRDQHLLRAVARAVRRVARGRARTVRVPARPQRRGQVHGDALDHGAESPAQGRVLVERPGDHRLARRPHRARRHRLTCPRTGACSRELTVQENLEVRKPRRDDGRGAGRSMRRGSSFRSSRRCATGARVSCPAASSRCSPSRAR